MQEKPHYVNNAQFSQAVVDYVTTLNEAKNNNLGKPIVPNYVAECFLKIAEGLSHKANFVRYTYREEMVMDAVENCLKAIENYNLETATRTGKPNAFAYFTQISWYAFLRRIQKEKKQAHIKNKMIEKRSYDTFTTMEGDDTPYQVRGFDPDLMLPDEDVYKPKKKETVQKTNGLENFMELDD